MCIRDRHMSRLFKRELRKSENLISSKLSKNEDQIIYNDYQKLKNIIVFLISAITTNSRQNIITINISSFNETTIKITFSNSNLLVDQEFSRLTPPISYDERESEVSQQQEKFLFTSDVQQIAELVGQLGPEKKIDFEQTSSRNTNLSIKIYRNLDQIQAQPQHPKSQFKRREFMPINIIAEESQEKDLDSQSSLGDQDHQTITINDPNSSVQQVPPSQTIAAKQGNLMQNLLRPQTKSALQPNNSFDQRNKQEATIRKSIQSYPNNKNSKSPTQDYQVNYPSDKAEQQQLKLNSLIKKPIKILLIGNNQYITQSFPKLLSTIQNIEKVDIASTQEQINTQLSIYENSSVEIQNLYKFIIIDDDIPEIDHFVLTQKIKAKIMDSIQGKLYTKIIILINRFQVHPKLSASKIGADCYLVKPIELPSLIITCQQFLA
eukprot:TRINITY_DN11492_c0_g1_i1.p1 TRINITY_DN11492_c0_g1~~TRINITY_DN11492_c0_g1_i1.p1  ORF type:complete len:435 (+),score=67.26 TRINITY_DN11492_c0_g1_i1:189-1493(+)